MNLYDPKCEELARHFVSDDLNSKERIADLAAAIQSTIEDWIEAETAMKVAVDKFDRGKGLGIK